MKLHPRWPYLTLLAGHLFDLGPSEDYHEIDIVQMDQQEAQLRNWLSEIAGEAAIADHQSLRQKVKVARLHRDQEKPDGAGRQPWFNILYVYDMDHVLVEEVLSYPLNEDLSSPPARMRRYSRMRFKDCPKEAKRLFLVAD